MGSTFTRSPGPVNPEQELSSPRRLWPPEFTAPLQSGPLSAVFVARIALEGVMDPEESSTPPPDAAPVDPAVPPLPPVPPEARLSAEVVFRSVTAPVAWIPPPIPAPPFPPRHCVMWQPDDPPAPPVVELPVMVEFAART